MENGFVRMGRDNIDRHTEEGDERWYYRNEDVYFVVTTITKAHRDEAHLHTENAETYYVARGLLILYVKGERMELRAGDMVVVAPGVCHSFETTGEEVCFYAMRNHPLLDDKQLC